MEADRVTSSSFPRVREHCRNDHFFFPSCQLYRRKTEHLLKALVNDKQQMVAVKVQADAANVTQEIQDDSEKCCRFEVCHSSLSL